MIEKVKLSEYHYKCKLTADGWQDLVDENGINQFSCWGSYDEEALFAIQSKSNDNFYLARVLDTYIEEYYGDEEIKVLAFYVDIDENKGYFTRQEFEQVFPGQLSDEELVLISDVKTIYQLFT